MTNNVVWKGICECGEPYIEDEENKFHHIHVDGSPFPEKDEDHEAVDVFILDEA
ncbi:MAG: hypothetical protein QM500_19560 [Methylococcales bacterium]